MLATFKLCVVARPTLLHAHLKDNWKTQLTSLYAGEMEAVFSVESEDDGAVPLIQEIQEELKDRLVMLALTLTLTPTTLR